MTKVTTGLKQLVAQVLLPEVRSEEEAAAEAGAEGDRILTCSWGQSRLESLPSLPSPCLSPSFRLAPLLSLHSSVSRSLPGCSLPSWGLVKEVQSQVTGVPGGECLGK